jgi:nicotinamidase/pyrazinamidase
MKNEKRIAINDLIDVLIIIDPQNDFADPDGSLFVRGVTGESSNSKTIKNINLLKKLFSYVYISEDCHPENSIEFKKFPRHCIKGSWGAKRIKGLDSNVFIDFGFETTILKGGSKDVVSYSISTSNYYESLINFLRSTRTEKIFLCGWAYTHCVGESAIDLAKQGIDVYIVRDATRSVPPPHGDPETMKKKLQLYGVNEVSMRQIV